MYRFMSIQELKETRKKLEELTEKRDDLGKDTQKMRDDLAEAQEEIKRTGRELKDLKTRMRGTVDEKDNLSGVSTANFILVVMLCVKLLILFMLCC
jgi:uncharacterized coiled-coil DUF342 family protein